MKEELKKYLLLITKYGYFTIEVMTKIKQKLLFKIKQKLLYMLFLNLQKLFLDGKKDQYTTS